MGFENMPKELQTCKRRGFETRTKEELREFQRKGRSKTARTLANKKTLRESMMNAIQEPSAEDPTKTNGDIIAGKMVEQAKEGDVSSTKLAAQITGDLAPKQVEVGGIADGTPIQHMDFSSVSDEELHKMLGD